MNGINLRITGEPSEVERARDVIDKAMTAAGWRARQEPKQRHLRVVRDDERTTA